MVVHDTTQISEIYRALDHLVLFTAPHDSPLRDVLRQKRVYRLMGKVQDSPKFGPWRGAMRATTSSTLVRSTKDNGN